MTETEHKRQIIKATVNEELIKMNLRIGKASKEELLTAQGILKELQGYVVATTASSTSTGSVTAATVKSPPTPSGGVVSADVAFTPEVAALLEGIKAKKEKIDFEKGMLSNQLHTIPDGVRCEGLVRQILAKRNEWIDASDEYYFVMRHGHLPAVADNSFDTDGYVQTLPENLLELDQKRRNLISSISKYRKRLAESKTDIAKQRQEQNINIASLQLASIENILSLKR
jgi:hypothetical protein